MKIAKSKLKQIIKEELALEAENAHAAEGRALLGMLEEFLKRYSGLLVDSGINDRYQEKELTEKANQVDYSVRQARNALEVLMGELR